MARLGIDARLYRESGVGRYIRNLLSHLQEIDKQNQYVVFLLDKDFDEVELAENFTKVRANFRWYGLTEQIKFPWLLKKYHLDLVHFPHFNVPIFYRGKYVVTIHDLIHQKVQMSRATTRDPLTYRIKQLGYKKAFTTALNKSLKVLTVSDYVGEELAKLWQIDPDKVVVTKEAAEEDIVKLAAQMNQSEIKKVLEKYQIEGPYIFYVGNAHPHKNVEGLIKAFLSLKSHPEVVSGSNQIPDRARNDYQGLKLVLAGHDHYFWERIKRENQHQDIIYAGNISDHELVAMYKGAKAFVMPSFEEGFGIPLLEAFACGCPVASSNAASLPEVGGDACIYFNPRQIDDMVETIQQLLNDAKLQKELVTKGAKRYPQFSWRNLARQTLVVYDSVL